MNKQYKLVKCYPNSPELGTIAEEKNGSIYFPNTKMTWSCSVKDYFKKTIIDNPEFWEEIKQEEYTILSVKTPSGAILEYDENGNCIKRSDLLAPKYTYNLEKILESGKSYIHSVRRNSDGVVFTVGDLCNPIGEHCKNRQKITKIEFCKAGYLRLKSKNYYLSIDLIEHSKVLFKTEDNVDIKIGDEYYTVRIKEINSINGPYVADGEAEDYDFRFVRVFSTKEAGENCILLNKPSLSINEVFDLLEGNIKGWYTNEKITEIFKNYIKNRDF